MYVLTLNGSCLIHDYVRKGSVMPPHVKLLYLIHTNRIKEKEQIVENEEVNLKYLLDSGFVIEKSEHDKADKT